MQDAIVAGKTEMECYMPSTVETLAEMVREMPGWRPIGFGGGSGLTAMFVGGRSTAMPHGFVKGHGIRNGARQRGASPYRWLPERAVVFVGDAPGAGGRPECSPSDSRDRTMGPGVGP
jgi:hypothetical protein